MAESDDTDPPADPAARALAPPAAPFRLITPAMARRYVAERGARCPFCGGADILAEEAQADADSSWCAVDCPDCGAGWREVYRLSALDQLDEWGRVVDTVDGTGPPPIAEVLAEGAAPGEPTRPVALYVGEPPGAGGCGRWQPRRSMCRGGCRRAAPARPRSTCCGAGRDGGAAPSRSSASWPSPTSPPTSPPTTVEGPVAAGP
jgi:hypothetical protein